MKALLDKDLKGVYPIGNEVFLVQTRRGASGGPARGRGEQTYLPQLEPSFYNSSQHTGEK